MISESQSAFISGRLITDNILVASEVGHYLNRKQCGAVGWSALKLDMAKAYDCMEWPFLRGMLVALGFHVKWIDLIMMCVSTVSYSFLVNGIRSDAIIPTRGLRQGDPLSPFLFIICAEGLSLLLQRAQDRGLIHGCRVARGAPAVSHIFFADDSLLFFKATGQEAIEIKKLPVTVLEVMQAPNFGKYLGLPSFIGRNKKAAFAYIEDKIRQRIGYWNKKLLSQAAWDKLCFPKKYGGLGFKDLKAFNVALLGKQAWRLLTNTESLVSKVYKARYYPRLSFMEAELGNNPSHCWRSIMAAKSLVCSGVRRRIGNGNSTSVWNHPGLQDGEEPMIQTEMPPQLADIRVANLMDQGTGTWDYHLLIDIFEPEDVSRILKIPVSQKYEDQWYWHGDPNGCYSVKDGYRRIIGNYESSMNPGFNKWLTLWKQKIPPKWRMFIWKAINDILPTTNNLRSKRVDVSPLCAVCGVENEDVMHALVFCDYAKAIWTQSNLPSPSIVTNVFYEWFDELLNILDSYGIPYAAAILYYLWKARNGAVWDACLTYPRKTMAMIHAAVNIWRKVHLPPPIAAAPNVAADNQPPGVLTAVQSNSTHPLGQRQQCNKCFVDAAYFDGSNQASDSKEQEFLASDSEMKKREEFDFRLDYNISYSNLVKGLLFQRYLAALLS
ncbi:PREDICTED: uncharacterized protein LOC109149044 [Ipomoea nil]|uniref:uncharacterized protein LOC109149044 n=1 Tax=Ipomoea nil TaxID=35883 RepID=UPI0009010E6F|nr:PREDICTED: uncharacterized protein LOC109149044 [Ipomoea nil]